MIVWDVAGKNARISTTRLELVVKERVIVKNAS